MDIGDVAPPAADTPPGTVTSSVNSPILLNRVFQLIPVRLALFSATSQMWVSKMISAVFLRRRSKYCSAYLCDRCVAV